MTNIQDWCISRQLWWGHQIPVWNCSTCGEATVSRETPLACGKCNTQGTLTQDADVLDTWFSSGLWPFATLGWPDDTAALKTFYPASILETGYDILFFWVARMMMFGLHFMGKVPFKRVLLSGLIVDETGDKMSKVKGNVIDPLDLVHGAEFQKMVPDAEAMAKFKKAYPSAAQMGTGFPAFGADAVRFTLATYPPSNMRIALAPKRIEGNRHFLNKIWNATRLSVELLGGSAKPPEKRPEATDAFNKWILSRLANAATIARAGLEAFRIDEAANELYRFFWYDFCDWYLEIVKPRLRDKKDPETAATLAYVLGASLRLLHPFVPFVTEELWQKLHDYPEKFASIALEPFPDGAGRDPDVEARVKTLMDVIVAARTVRAEHGIKWVDAIPLVIRGASDFVKQHAAEITRLVNTAPTFEPAGGERPKGYTMSVVRSPTGTIEVLAGLKGLVDPKHERERIEREIKKCEKDLAAIEKKLSSKNFADKAPKEVIEEAHAQKKAMEEALVRLKEALALVDEL
jgi:valyl-tRNA synthetase